jgi:anaphase-promoting complex subunit 10
LDIPPCRPRTTTVAPALEPERDSREVGGLGVWSVTSAKPGNGVDLLRDGRDDTYWQSDGAQPHLVSVQFQRRVLLKELAIYIDSKLDESYAPQRLCVRAGTSWTDLREVAAVELQEPQGWVVIPVTPDANP